MSQDESFVDYIVNGPHIHLGTIIWVGAANGTIGLDRIVPKNSANYSLEDLEEINKDKRAMNILYNVIDSDMFESVMNSDTTKEV